MTKSVTITGDNAAMLEHLVSSGQYESIDAALDDAFGLLMDREWERHAAETALKEAIELGLEDSRAGRVTTFNSSEEIARHFDGRAKALLAGRKKAAE